MGRAPVIDDENDETVGMDVGMDAMLEALESTFTALQEGRLTTEDFFSFTFKTSDCNKQYGSRNGSSTWQSSDGKGLALELVKMVRSTFQDVEDGSLKEGGYYFELSTEYWTFESGDYPPHESDEFPSSDEKQEPVYVVASRNEIYYPRTEPILKHLSPRIAIEYEVLLVKRLIKMTTWSLISIQLVIPLLVVASALVGPAGASPIHAPKQPLTLTAGKDGTIPFKCSNDHQSNMPKYYTVTIEGKDRPFYLDGSLDPEGLMTPDQADRFRVEYIENENEMSIEIHIVSVSLKDQGTYIVMVIIPGEIPESRLMKQVVIIYIPPATAICFLKLSESKIRPYEVQCHTKPRNGNSTLACFQNNAKIPYYNIGMIGGKDNQVVDKRVFWLEDTSSPVSCCAHDLKEIATIYEALCNQFQWSPAHHPDQTEKISTKKVQTTKPPSSDSEMQLPPAQTTVNSGCAQNWSKAMLPLMTTMVTFAAMPYIVT